MSYKLVLVKHEPGYEEDDPGQMRVAPLETVSELWQYADRHEWELRQEILNLMRSVVKSGDSDVLDILAGEGWVNAKTVQDRDLKLSLQKRFFILYPPSASATSYFQAQAIDPCRITTNAANWLAQEAEVVQVVNTNTLKAMMSKEALDTYNRAVKMFKTQKDREKAAAAKRAETKIARAKKILEEAGELKDVS